MKRLPLFFCLVFFACDPKTSDDVVGNDDVTGNEQTDEPNQEIDGPIHYCKPYLSKSSFSPLLKDTLYFDEQGGVDTVDIGRTSIRYEDFSKEYTFYNMDDYKYLSQCNFFLVDHYKWGEGDSRIKVESDYCKNNYCSNEFERTYSGSPHMVPIMKIECSWFSVTHVSKDSVQVLVNKNETGEERSAYIPLIGGGCALMIVDDIKIIQSAGAK